VHSLECHEACAVPDQAGRSRKCCDAPSKLFLNASHSSASPPHVPTGMASGRWWRNRLSGAAASACRRTAGTQDSAPDDRAMTRCAIVRSGSAATELSSTTRGLCRQNNVEDTPVRTPRPRCQDDRHLAQTRLSPFPWEKQVQFRTASRTSPDRPSGERSLERRPARPRDRRLRSSTPCYWAPRAAAG